MFISQPTLDLTTDNRPPATVRWAPVNCDRCFEIGMRIAPSGQIEPCPTLTLGGEHCELKPEGARICRAIEGLWKRRVDVDQIHFEIARTLSQYSTARPCPTRELTDRHFSYVTGDENRRRKVTLAVRFLRDIWMLPVASRKDKPAGYWIAVDESDFKDWFERAKREPITHVSTLHRLAKANWPVFAEQVELEFWKDMGRGDAA